jgi:hypothetical protein
MKMQLLGGPLDGTVIETPERSIEPELVHFSESRRVHHYLWHDGGEFRYLSRDTIIDDRTSFERWWASQNLDESAKEIAWTAWHEALLQF